KDARHAKLAIGKLAEVIRVRPVIFIGKIADPDLPPPFVVSIADPKAQIDQRIRINPEQLLREGIRPIATMLPALILKIHPDKSVKCWADRGIVIDARIR